MTDKLRFALTAAMLIAVALLLHARNQREIVPGHRVSSIFPLQLGRWTGNDVNISRQVLDVLGPGDFLFRNYSDNRSSDPPVNLFLAYFPTQRVGDTIHSPKNCLPGGGWAPLDSARTALRISGQTIVVNRYLIAKGSERALVFYWYSAHGRTTASEYVAKLYLIEDSIRMHRSDGALARITTELRPAESVPAAEERLLAFLSDAAPSLQSYLTP
jgi:EpsI family protein